MYNSYCIWISTKSSVKCCVESWPAADGHGVAACPCSGASKTAGGWVVILYQHMSYQNVSSII